MSVFFLMTFEFNLRHQQNPFNRKDSSILARKMSNVSPENLQEGVDFLEYIEQVTSQEEVDNMREEMEYTKLMWEGCLSCLKSRRHNRNPFLEGLQLQQLTNDL